MDPISLLRRPSRWSISPTNIAAPFGALWNKMEMCFPFWRWQDDSWDSGWPKDFAMSPYYTQWRGNNFQWTTTAGITWDVGDINPGIRINGTNNILQSQNTVTGGQSRTVYASFSFNSFPSSGYRWVIGLQSGGAWLCDVGVAADGSILFYEVTGGTVTLTSATGLVKKNRQHSLVCVTDNALGMAIYLDGRKVASNGTTGYLNISLQLQANGSNSPFSGNSSDYLLYACGAFPWALREQEALALSQNIFGLITPIEVEAAYAEAGAPGSGTPDPAISTWAALVPNIAGSITADPAISSWSTPDPTSAVAAIVDPANSTWNTPAVETNREVDDAVFGQVYPK